MAFIDQHEEHTTEHTTEQYPYQYGSSTGSGFMSFVCYQRFVFSDQERAIINTGKSATILAPL
jgi:hypothetical protein